MKIEAIESQRRLPILVKKSRPKKDMLVLNFKDPIARGVQEMREGIFLDHEMIDMMGGYGRYLR